MKKMMLVAAFLLLYSFSGSSYAAQNPIEGDWVGGAQIKDKWYAGWDAFSVRHALRARARRVTPDAIECDSSRGLLR